MTVKKLRIGIIGLGGYAAGAHVPNLRATGRAEVVAAARRNPEHLARAQHELGIPQTYTDWREMLTHTDLDAVVVSTPHNLHCEPTLAALQRGLHVLLEKPLATSVSEAQTILQAVNQSDRVVMMGVNRRGDPSWRTVQFLLASGQLGQVRQISAVMCTDVRILREVIPVAQPLQDQFDASEFRRSWRNDPLQMGGDMFNDIGAHLVDAMLWMAGAPVVEVLAYAPKNRPQGAAILTVQALLANDIILSITFNDNVALGDEFSFQTRGRLTVYGDEGVLTADMPNFPPGPVESIMLERHGVKQAVGVEGQVISPAEAFVACILDGAPNIAPVADAAQAVFLIQGAYCSIAERRILRVNDGA